MTHAILPFPFEPDKTVVDGRFLVKGELGQGGMGRCYRVWQQSLERLCVLKMLAPRLHPRFLPHQDARALLEQEAKTLGLLGLGNDSFVQVFDRGVLYLLVRQDGEEFELDLPYYTMEFLHGYSLEVLIDSRQQRGEPLPWDVIVSFGAQAARAIAVAHERGVIHRDLKPDNLFLHVRFDRVPLVKLIDFGVSTREGAESFFGTGTARYGAPELLSRQASRESTQSDIYPLGLVLFELAALRGPFVARSKRDFLRAHIWEEPPPLAALRPDTPPWFAKLVARMLAKDPKARPTAKEVGAALEGELARMASAQDTGREIARLLGTVSGPEVRQSVARRTMVTAPGGRAAPTISAESLVESSPRKSALYLSRTAAQTAPERKTAPFDAGAAPPAAPPTGPIEKPAEPSIVAGTPAVSIAAPVIVEAAPGSPPDGRSTAPAPDASEGADASPEAPPGLETLPAAGIDDIADVPVFRSMAHVFEAVWDESAKAAPAAASPASLQADHAAASGPPADVNSVGVAASRTSAATSTTDDPESRPAAPRRRGTLAWATAGGLIGAAMLAGAVALLRVKSPHRPALPAGEPAAAAPSPPAVAAASTTSGTDGVSAAGLGAPPATVEDEATGTPPEASAPIDRPAAKRATAPGKPAALHAPSGAAPGSPRPPAARAPAQRPASPAPSASPAGPAPIFGDWLATSPEGATPAPRARQKVATPTDAGSSDPKEWKKVLE